ncbi:WYL domain-containing protein [Acidithiobacillus albertensis]|uniref:WYL domain-containing protein n=1 Tax=Acidithiobacillus albertensis TaxID=119978 RepID=UPI00094B2EF5|nr:WYL domain-containing protein [Acidithiobacillus albertensis]MBU2741303.1 WYL domain-containing protein [Acidithiobacillus albertensis]
MVPCEFPEPINRPSTEMLAQVTRAIRARSVLSVSYVSLSEGESKRKIVPFALADNGLRWHARAFDRKSGEFRDFVLTRIRRASPVAGATPGPEERQESDIQWNRIVELDLVPHPDGPRPDVSALDYPMEDCVLRLRVRAALAGYVLRRWSDDRSSDHALRGPEYRLWLRDPLALYGVESATLAPGYAPPGAAS